MHKSRNKARKTVRRAKGHHPGPVAETGRRGETVRAAAEDPMGQAENAVATVAGIAVSGAAARIAGASKARRRSSWRS